MLQIATGKLFSRPASRENELRGVLYSNARLGYEAAVITAAGRLLSSSSFSVRPHVLVYEFTERIETEVQGPQILVSSGVEPYLQDFAVAISFALNCTCAPDIALTHRLTSGQRGLATRVAPQTLVRRFFDPELWCKPEEQQFLIDFIAKLIGLPRRTFLGVMRALRTYVNGMHRIGDDLELAYTLLVASVESLAQDFDGHESDWESFDERKRNAVDEALAGAESAVAQRVRQALLQVEHVALARRFREFAMVHTTPQYFRPGASSDGPALARSDLAEVLGQAYQSRSKYMHQLRRLPDMVTLGDRYGETAVEGRATHLTLQGLSRLMRGVIIEFVQRQPTVQREPHNYTLERSGVVQVRMAPQYWVGWAQGDIRRHGRDKLEGFLEQLASCLLKEPDSVLTDLRPVLAAAAAVASNLEKRLRRPYLALHALFNLHVAAQDVAPTPAQVAALIEQELDEPCSEALISHALCDQPVGWPLDIHQAALDTYRRRRGASNGLRFPRLFEAALALDLAERHRSSGNMKECRATVASAVENHPGHPGLQEFESGLRTDAEIRWRKVLLPPPEQTQQPSA